MCTKMWGYCLNGHRVKIFKPWDPSTWTTCGRLSKMFHGGGHIPVKWANDPSPLPPGTACHQCPDWKALKQARRVQRMQGDLEARAQESRGSFGDINWNSSKTGAGQGGTPASGVSPVGGTAASSVSGDDAGGSGGYQSGGYSGSGGGGDQGHAEYYEVDDDIYNVSHQGSLQGSRQGSQGGSGSNSKKSSQSGSRSHRSSGKNSQSGSRG